MTETDSNTGTKGTKSPKRHYTVVPFPKIVFFYPLMFISVACGFMELFAKGTGASHSVSAGTLFIVVFLINILVIAFDFPGVKALALALGIIATGLLVYVIDQEMDGALLGVLGRSLRTLQDKLYASPAFYFVTSAILFIMIMGGILVNVLWNRWTIEPNRLMHKHGLLGDVKEYPVIDLQVEKRIEDVFEYGLLLAGTLTFAPNPNTPPIKLENVPFINRAERKIQMIVRRFTNVG